MTTRVLCLAVALALLCPHAPAQWVRTNGLDSMGVMSLAASGTSLFAGGFPMGVFLSTNNGESWRAVNSGLNMQVWALLASGGNLLAGTWGGAYLSANNGASWTSIPTMPTTWLVTCFLASGPYLFAGAVENPLGASSGGIFRSDDNGWRWSPANTGLPTGFAPDALAAVPNAVYGTNVIAGGSVCDSTCHGSIFLSTNNGYSWTQTGFGLGLSVVALGVSGTRVYAGSHDRLLVSTDRGSSWRPVSTWPSGGVSAIGGIGRNVFASTVFLSSDSGATWRSVATGLPPDHWVRSFAVVGEHLFAGTKYYGGVWRRRLSEMITSVDPELDEIPHEFLLSQNYPNPFNPTTTIRYALPGRFNVTLTVYNTLGQEVRFLMQGEKEAGSHDARFDGAGLPSGTYFYRLRAGGIDVTRRMLLVK